MARLATLRKIGRGIVGGYKIAKQLAIQGPGGLLGAVTARAITRPRASKVPVAVPQRRKGYQVNPRRFGAAGYRGTGLAAAAYGGARSVASRVGIGGLAKVALPAAAIGLAGLGINELVKYVEEKTGINIPILGNSATELAQARKTAMKVLGSRRGKRPGFVSRRGMKIIRRANSIRKQVARAARMVGYKVSKWSSRKRTSSCN